VYLLLTMGRPLSCPTLVSASSTSTRTYAHTLGYHPILVTQDLSSECIPFGCTRPVHAYYYALGLFRGYNVVERNNRL